MKYNKGFYKKLPEVNGYNWLCFIDGLHVFGKGLKFICLKEDDVLNSKTYSHMLNNDMSRPNDL